MKIEIKVPAMGESISEATVGVILKKSGSPVLADDEVLELETDKVNQVLFAPQKGVVTFSVSEGDVVKVGQVIGYVDSEQVSDVKEEPKPVEPEQQAKKEPEASVQETKKEPEAKSEIKIEPKAESKVQEGKKETARVFPESSLSDLKATDTATHSTQDEMPKGLTHSIDKEKKQAARQETRRKLSKIRQVIAARLVQAQHQAAMLTTFNEVDMTEIMSLREKYKEVFLKQHGVKLGFMSFFVKAAVKALEEFPDVNSYIDGDEIVHREYYDIGIAVGTDRGLIVPVIRDCDHLTFSGIESALEVYAKKARSGGLLVDDLTGGGFTITNGGVYGSLLSTPILNLPQSAILGMHKIMKRAVVVNDEIVIKPMMYLALSYDHRIIDGKEAVSFLVTIKNMLEDPTRLLLEV